MAKKTKVYIAVEDTDDLWFDPSPPRNSELANLTEIFSSGFQGNPPPRSYRPEYQGKGKTLIDPSALLDERKALQFYPSLETMRSSVFISVNRKTFASLNIRINGTQPLHDAFRKRFRPSAAKKLISRIPKIGASCRPTPWCITSCYAKAGMLVLAASQRQLLANLIHFDYLGKRSTPQAVVNQSADAVYKTMMLNWKGMAAGFRPNLRLMGSGDVVPGLTRWINTFAKRHPDFLLWGMTRRPDVVQRINNRENIVFQPSFDYTTPITKMSLGAWPVSKLWKLAKTRGWNLCYATEGSREDTLGKIRAKGIPVKTVFGYHGQNRMTELADPYECPGTSAKLKKTIESLNQGQWFRTVLRPGRIRPARAPGYASVSKYRGFFICQVCRWCMTPDVSKKGHRREDVLGREFPKQILTDPYFKPFLSPIQSNPATGSGVKFIDKAIKDQQRMPLFFRG